MMTDFDQSVLQILDRALHEDIGESDVTTDAIVPKEIRLSGKILAKEEGRVAGLAVLQLLYGNFHPDVELNIYCEDGSFVKSGQNIVKVKGLGRSLLTTERLALNILQRMSGIATQTSRFVENIRGTSAVILDTRKTAPGLRVLDKLAVQLGGGTNHRFGLFDSYLIKENHIEAAGSLTEAVRRVRAHNLQTRLVEVEVRSIAELREALPLDVDRILLDNMSVEDMKAGVKLAAGSVPLEASGNITLENVRQVAETGVDFISIGSLTHSVRALDLSFIIERA